MCIFGAPGVCSRGLLEFSLGFVTSQALLLQNHGLNPHHCFFFVMFCCRGTSHLANPAEG